MSRSTRRPYTAWCGPASAKDDKRLSARFTRRAQNRLLRATEDYDGLVMPDRRTCTWGDHYWWPRDGGKWLATPPDIRRLCAGIASLGPEDAQKWYEEEAARYVRLCRK